MGGRSNIRILGADAHSAHQLPFFEKQIYSSSSLRTAINASVGSCTVPKVRIFFLPAQTGLGPLGYPGMISMLGRSEFAISALRAALRAVALRNASLRLGVRQGFCLRQKRLYGAMRRPTLWGPRKAKRKCSAYSSSSLRTAINASVGSCTVPKVRIFFLPSFCFSSSFFFRVMSPP